MPRDGGAVPEVAAGANWQDCLQVKTIHGDKEPLIARRHERRGCMTSWTKRQGEGASIERERI